MKKILLSRISRILYGILSIFFAFGIACADDTQRTTNVLKAADAIVLQLKHQNKEITDSQYLKLLEKCDAAGNKFCSACIGEFYYDNKEYRKAFPYYFKSKNILLSQIALGDMYRFGYGVLQNSEKAILYHKLCAKEGEAVCAYGVWNVYLENRNYIQAYIWIKIFSALGGSEWKGKDRKKHNSYEVLQQLRVFMTKNQTQEADITAQRICKTIPACNL